MLLCISIANELKPHEIHREIVAILTAIENGQIF
jgi:hypothetical protein